MDSGQLKKQWPDLGFLPGKLSLSSTNHLATSSNFAAFA